MKVLFVLQCPGYLRYFDSVLEALCQRGHQVAVAFDLPNKQAEWLAVLDTIDGKVEVLDPVPARQDIWKPVARGVRATIDYARYLHPRFKDSSYLRDRMRVVLPWLTRGLGYWTTVSVERTGRLIRLLQACELAVPSSRILEAYLRHANPTVLVVSPLVTDQCPQVDLLKAAQRVGLQSALCVASWDHLTTKGLMRIKPGLVTVWNRAQRQEAIDFHGVQEQGIVVTGAQCFDRWFERTPARPRDEFCRLTGLDPANKFVVFTGSTASISSPEAEVRFVRHWIEAVRSGPSSLRDIGLLIRPHPYNSVQWATADLASYHNVVVYPQHGSDRVGEGDRADYYDTLHHAAGIVGINTSAMVEAGIQDRPVFTIIDSSFDDTQTGTLHFRYLLPENGGHLIRAISLDEHAQQLAAIIEGKHAPSAHQFVQTFVRPNGIGRAATPRLADALEQLSFVKPVPEEPVLWHLLVVRVGLWLVAAVVAIFDVSRIRKWYRKARSRYSMAIWRFYKSRRKHYRKWRERRTRIAKKARRSRSGGAAS
ncbi:MAG: hypothetical protein CL484_14345 [Acidobacteria bacterium]|nr:hypothetical protein [Acidobacteriota bacterium]